MAPTPTAAVTPVVASRTRLLLLAFGVIGSDLVLSVRRSVVGIRACTFC